MSSTTTNQQHANEAVIVIDVLKRLPPNEKIMVLKTAAAMVENSLHAEIQAQAIFNALNVK